MLLIDTLCHRSGLFRIHDTAKLVFGTMTLLICVSFRINCISAVIIIAFALLTIFIGKIPARFYLRLFILPAAFILSGVVVVVFQISPDPPAPDAFSIPAGGWYLYTSKALLLSALNLALTAWGAVSCLYFIALSTPVTGILQVLRKLKCPALMIELMLFIYRFIFILWTLAGQLNTARRSRLGDCTAKQSLRSFSAMLSSLLVKSMKKASASLDAMESRGYDGEILTLKQKQHLPMPYLICAGLFDLILLTAAICIRMI